jgi:DNA helicase TIP49 (TBP-interacting protein)
MHFFTKANGVICLNLWGHIDKNVVEWQEEGKVDIVPGVFFVYIK